MDNSSMISMKFTSTVISAIFPLLISVETVDAQPDTQASKSAFDSDIKVTDQFWKNYGDTFRGSNLLLHAMGIASTFAIVGSGLDARIHEEFKDHPSGVSDPGAYIGAGILTAGLATHLFFKGKSEEDRKILGSAYMIAQTAVIAFTYIHTLKALTGRPNPDIDSSVPIRQQSEKFQYGVFRRGIYDGWPSGHVSHTVAVTSALAHYYPEKRWISWAGAGLSAYMVYSVTAADDAQMHWFSEGVAGAFMGYAIGSTLGKNWRAKIEGREPEAGSISWFPFAAPGNFGAQLVYRF